MVWGGCGVVTHTLCCPTKLEYIIHYNRKIIARCVLLLTKCYMHNGETLMLFFFMSWEMG